MTECIVNTQFGKIIGLQLDEAKVFKSIPFAQTKRFEPPQPVEPWEQFDATGKNLQQNCPQRFAYVDEAAEKGFYYTEFDSTRVSEFVETPTCLNITTPLSGEHLPVVVYFHGGSFENGCINDEPFGTCYEYAKRGIILVSAGYRLNVFGLYDSQNYGLQDMCFAIKWVKNNIYAFGGDENHIVIMGQSAGAMCVQDLLYNSDLKSEIKGAIMLSGAGLIPPFVGPKTQEENHQFWQKVMEKAGCENQQQLVKVDAQVLWQAWYDTKQTDGNFHISMPSIDGKIVKDVPQNIVKRNEDLDVPMLVSVTSQDMFPMVIYDWALDVGKRAYRRKRNPVYGCFFDRKLPGNVYKAFHASDLWYQFGLKSCWRPFEQIDYDLSKTMIDYTANFIKNLNPNGDGLPNWPAISRLNHKFRWFSENSKTLISPLLCRLKLYYSWLFDKGPY